MRQRDREPDLYGLAAEIVIRAWFAPPDRLSPTDTRGSTLAASIFLTTTMPTPLARIGVVLSSGATTMTAGQQESEHTTQPDRPSTGCYLEDIDWEADARQFESSRPGSMDLKAITLFRDGHRCRRCGIRATPESSEMDHVEPVNRFASYAQATHLLNLQTLCLECHMQKTRDS